MKIKTNELIGPALDWAVAKCDGVEVWREPDGIYLCEGGEVGFMFRPSTDWSQGGPIIERNHIALDYYPDGSYDNGGMWLAVITRGAEDGVEDGIEQIAGEGPTPLVAAMRCFVASRLGEEVEVPDDMEN